MKGTRDVPQWSLGNWVSRFFPFSDSGKLQVHTLPCFSATLTAFTALYLIWFLWNITGARAAELLLRTASHRWLSPGNSPIAHCAWAEDMIVIQLTMGSVLLGRRWKLMFLPFSTHPLIPPSTVFPIQALVDVLMASFQIGLDHDNVTMNFFEKSRPQSEKREAGERITKLTDGLPECSCLWGRLIRLLAKLEMLVKCGC